SRESEVVSGLVSFRSNHMYDLRLSAEQLQIRDTVRDFVAEVIKPLALKPERLEARARPLLVEALDQAAQIGLRTLALSEEQGGAGADNLTCCIVTEELAVGDPDIAAVLAQTSTLAQALFDRLMTAEQRAHFLPPFLAEARYHLALAEHEADRDAALGINYHRPQTSGAPFRTTAVRAGDDWVVNGSKDGVVGASLAALFVVRASIGEGGATLLVPRDTPGLSVTATEAATRTRHGACGAVAFDDCRVPAENFSARKARSRPMPGAISRRSGAPIRTPPRPPRRRRSITRTGARRAGPPSPSTRRPAPSSPRSRPGSKSRAPPLGRRPGRRPTRTLSPIAAPPTCRSPP